MGSLNIDISLGQKTILKNYLYMDVTMDVSVLNNNRDIQTSYDFDAVQNSIKNIFTFHLGEKILVPDFGNTLYHYVYEPITDSTSEELGRDILNLIQKWEPRVKITKLNIRPIPDENTYYIEVFYTIPSLSTTKVLNFNYNLTGS